MGNRQIASSGNDRIPIYLIDLRFANLPQFGGLEPIYLLRKIRICAYHCKAVQYMVNIRYILHPTSCY